MACTDCNSLDHYYWDCRNGSVNLYPKFLIETLLTLIADRNCRQIVCSFSPIRSQNEYLPISRRHDSPRQHSRLAPQDPHHQVLRWYSYIIFLPPFSLSFFISTSGILLLIVKCFVLSNNMNVECWRRNFPIDRVGICEIGFRLLFTIILIFSGIFSGKIGSRC